MSQQKESVDKYIQEIKSLFEMVVQENESLSSEGIRLAKKNGIEYEEVIVLFKKKNTPENEEMYRNLGAAEGKVE
jgi:hypothetical protein